MAESEVYEVEKILDQRDVENQLQFYVKWKNFDEDWNTWEPIDNLLDCFDLVLEFQEKNEILKHTTQSTIDAKKSKLARKEALKIVKKAKKLNSSEGVKKALQKHAAIIVNDESPDLSLSVDTSFNSQSQKSPKSSKSPKSPKCQNGSPKSKNTNSDGTSVVKRTPKKPSKLDEFYDLSYVKICNMSSSKNVSGSPKKKVKSNSAQTIVEIPSLNLDQVQNSSEDHSLTEKHSKGLNEAKKKKKNIMKKTNGIKTLKSSEKKLKKKKTGNMLLVKMTPFQKKTKKNTSDNKSTCLSDQEGTPINKSEKEQKSSEEKKMKKKKQVIEKTASTVEGVKKKVKKKIKTENPESSSEKMKLKKDKPSPKDITGEKKIKKKENNTKKSLKRKLDQIEIIDTESDDDMEIRYSVSPKSKKIKTENSPSEYVTSGKIEIPRKLEKELSKKTLQVKVKPMETSHVKKMRLIDTMKSPLAVSKAKSFVRPVSPTPVFTSVKPIMSTARPMMQMESFCGDIPGYHYVPAMIPISPSSMSYKMILDNLPFQFHPKKSSKKREDDTMRDDDVERRLSVRQSECAYKYKEIVVKKCNKYTQIWLNTRTKLKNSLNPQVIQEIVAALNSAKYDDSNLVMFGGLGNVFCSGIDLTFLISMDRKIAARKMVDALRDFMKAIITFPKPLIAVVTGSAIGLGMTMLPLCDIVYASDKASFHLPYAQLSQTPEGCASFMLPTTVGMAMANELLIGGRKITAIEACQLGLVSQVFWPTSIMQEVIPRIENMALQSGKALETTKLLIRSHQRTKIELTNESECNLLLERWPSSECQKAIENYLSNENNFSI